MTPEISVIIPALNEQKYIGHVLSGLDRQTFRDFEAIVVDGGSQDKTRKLARKHAKVIVSRKNGAGAARNAGAKQARGRVLLFLDADTMPSPGLLRAYHGAFSDGGVAASSGPIYPLEKAPRRVRWGYKFVSVYFVKASILLHRPSLVGSNFAVRADVFRKAMGFNEQYITYEDWDLSNRLKRYGAIKYTDDAVVHTSARRVAAWGVSGYLIYYIVNMMLYHLLRRPRSSYKRIR